jgi:uridylate kinase
MDATAITTCMDNDLPIQVINLWDEKSLVKVVSGEAVGTLITH